MDRARVLCPSISFVAHAAGAATLAMAPLLLPAALPEPGGARHVFVPGSLSMTVGGGVGGGGALRTRPESRPPRVAAPASVAPIVPEATLDLGGCRPPSPLLPLASGWAATSASPGRHVTSRPSTRRWRWPRACRAASAWSA
jgi:hypothetical protein